MVLIWSVVLMWSACTLACRWMGRVQPKSSRFSRRDLPRGGSCQSHPRRTASQLAVVAAVERLLFVSYVPC